MVRSRFLATVALSVAKILVLMAPEAAPAKVASQQQRWVRLEGNLTVDSVSTLVDQARKARAAAAMLKSYSG